MMSGHDSNVGNQPSSGEVLPIQGPITEADREWLEALGCAWPSEEEQGRWLEELNQVVTLGSENISPAASAADRERIVTARWSFLDRLTNVTAEARANVIGPYSMPTFMPLDTVIGTQRVLYMNGIDATQLMNERPTLFGFDPYHISNKIDNLRERGVDPAQVATKWSEAFVLSIDTIGTRLDTLFSFGISAADVNRAPAILRFDTEAAQARLGAAGAGGVRLMRLFRQHRSWLDMSPEQVAQEVVATIGHSTRPSEVISFSAEGVKHVMELMRNRLEDFRQLGFTNEDDLYAIAGSLTYDVQEIGQAVGELQSLGFGATSFSIIGEFPYLSWLEPGEITNRVRVLQAFNVNVHELLAKKAAVVAQPSTAIYERCTHLVEMGINVPRAVLEHDRLLLYRISTVQQKAAALARQGIDVVRAAGMNANIFGVPAEEVEPRMQYLRSYGLNAQHMVEAYPMILALSPANVRLKMRICNAIAVAWRIEQPSETVNALVESWPQLLTYSPHKLRTIARIVTAMSSEDDRSLLNSSSVGIMVRANLERLVVAYLEHGDGAQSALRLPRLSRNYYGEVGKSALLERIELHRDDPVARAYLRGLRRSHTSE